MVQLVVPMFPVDARFLCCHAMMIRRREEIKEGKRRETDSEKATETTGKPEPLAWIGKYRDALASHHVSLLLYPREQQQQIATATRAVGGGGY